MFPQPEIRPHLTNLPISSESDDSSSSGGEDVEAAIRPSQTPLGGKPDQLIPQKVTPPPGIRTKGDVTDPVTGSAVTLQENVTCRIRMLLCLDNKGRAAQSSTDAA